MNFERLFQPIAIKGMHLDNRLVMPALHHQYTEGGFATERFNRYYWRRAEGGVGLVITGGCAVDGHVGYADMMSLADDRYIPGYKEFTDGMHRRGAKVAVQLMHTGRYGRKKYITGDDAAIAPSAVYSTYTRETPRAMTRDEIKTLICRWAQAASRAREAGFDAVEVTGASGYLISQFLSPVTNQREDEYGGSWENRCRFSVELISALRKAVGADYPLFMRVAGNDFIKGGNTGKECVAYCRMLEQVGIDMINVTGGWHETAVPQLPGEVPRGAFAYLAQAVKDAVCVPVMASNRFNDPVTAEKVLALGQADLIGIGRPLIADPDYPRKAYEGRADEIRHCVACNQGCLARMFFDRPVECLVNAAAGREYLQKEHRAAAAKKLLVVGGGPAGCEFAIQAARQGHQVTLWEKEGDIGGQLHIVKAPPSKKEFQTLIEYYRVMLKKADVKVMLHREARPDDIKSSEFDAVIVAAGVIYNRLALPEKGDIPVYSAADLLKGRVMAGRNVIVAGGGSVGCETAAYLAHEGSLSEEPLHFMLSWQSESIEKITGLLHTSRRNISIVDIDRVGAGFDPGCGWPVLADLKRLGVRQYPFTKIVNASEGKVLLEIKNKKNGEITHAELPCDTIVMAVGARPDNRLYEAVKNRGIPVYNIGDCAKVGKVMDAIRQADDLARML